MVFPNAFIKPCLTSNNLSPLNTASPIRQMSLSAILIGISVLIVVTPSQAQPLIPGGKSPNFEYRRYCSNSLLDLMRFICGGSFNSEYAQYPDRNGTTNSNTLNRFPTDDRNFLKTVQAERIRECCQRPCGYSELKLYCDPV